MRLLFRLIPILILSLSFIPYLYALNLPENSLQLEAKESECEFLRKKAQKSIRAGHLKQALEEVNTLIAQTPDSLWGYKLRANIYFSDKKYFEALSDFNEMIKLSPACASAYVDRAIVYLAMKDLEAAAKDIKKAIELKPMSAFAYCVGEKIDIAKAQVAAKVRGKER